MVWGQLEFYSQLPGKQLDGEPGRFSEVWCLPYVSCSRVNQACDHVNDSNKVSGCLWGWGPTRMNLA